MKTKHRIVLGAGALLLGAAVVVPTSFALTHLPSHNDSTTAAAQDLRQLPVAPGKEGKLTVPDRAEKVPLPPKNEKSDDSRLQPKPLESDRVITPSPKDVPHPSDLPPADNSNLGDDGSGRDGRTTADESGELPPLPPHAPTDS